MPPKDLVTDFYIPNYDTPFYKDYIIKPRQNIRIPIKIKREKIVASDSKDTENNNKNEEGKNDGGKEEKDNENANNKGNENEKGEEDNNDGVENKQRNLK